jgi:hypothetical protein
MRDHRRAARAASKLEGKAVLSGRADVRCTIRDLSATGARLSFRNPTILPRQFNLRFGTEDHRATVVWQAGLFAGVRFHAPTRTYVPAPKKRFAFWRQRS